MEFNGIGLLYLIIALISALTLHELAHALMSDYLGDTTARRQGRISLNPLAHIDPVMTVLLPLILIVLKSPVVFGAARPVPFNPWAVRYGKWGVALVAAAGPVTNFIIAIFFALWLHLFPVALGILPLFISIITINISFAIFNLIPIPPLDGSRILYAIAPRPLRDAMDRIEQHGLIIVFALLFIAAPVFMPALSGATSAVVQLLVPGLTGLST
jgi:Zn-dependent protease